MGLIVDSNIFIDDDRRSQTPVEVVRRISAIYPGQSIAISVIAIIEIDHGIHRTKTDADRLRRKAFADFLIDTMTILPITLEMAQLAGCVEGEQVEDLVLGTTALDHGDSVLTHNLRYMKLIPGLSILTF